MTNNELHKILASLCVYYCEHSLHRGWSTLTCYHSFYLGTCFYVHPSVLITSVSHTFTTIPILSLHASTLYLHRTRGLSLLSTLTFPVMVVDDLFCLYPLLHPSPNLSCYLTASLPLPCSLDTYFTAYVYILADSKYLRLSRRCDKSKLLLITHTYVPHVRLCNHLHLLHQLRLAFSFLHLTIICQ